MSFTVRYPLRFAHCDPAGIAYYPRYFELCDAAVEDWCADRLGLSRRHMHQTLGLGLPTVAMRATFSAPGRLGDLLDFALVPTRLGTSSIDLAITVTCHGQSRFTAEFTQVLTRLDSGKSEPWPDALRQLLAKEIA
jgi:4-hydroxybenzoyl-CoA thioesterase